MTDTKAHILVDPDFLGQHGQATDQLVKFAARSNAQVIIPRNTVDWLQQHAKLGCATDSRFKLIPYLQAFERIKRYFSKSGTSCRDPCAVRLQSEKEDTPIDDELPCSDTRLRQVYAFLVYARREYQSKLFFVGGLDTSGTQFPFEKYDVTVSQDVFAVYDMLNDRRREIELPRPILIGKLYTRAWVSFWRLCGFYEFGDNHDYSPPPIDELRDDPEDPEFSKEILIDDRPYYVGKIDMSVYDEFIKSAQRLMDTPKLYADLMRAMCLNDGAWQDLLDELCSPSPFGNCYYDSESRLRYDGPYYKDSFWDWGRFPHFSSTEECIEFCAAEARAAVDDALRSPLANGPSPAGSSEPHSFIEHTDGLTNY